MTAPANEQMPRPASGLFDIPTDQVHPSTTNPRRNLGDLDELVESVREVGILEPLVVRPHPDRPGAYENVAGHRRHRAASVVGLPTVPCIVRELTDLEVLEVQLVENLHRADLHPLDEADGYARLIDNHGYTTEMTADRVGRSTSYVRKRLQLRHLTPAGRQAFVEGRLVASTALVVARIPNASLQDEALAAVIDERNYRRAPMTARQAHEFVEEQYMLRLADAPFSRTDAELVAEAGACRDCPKRTGNQRELFDDAKGLGKDVCTDPPCFRRKVDAEWKRREAAAAENGQKVLTEKQAKKAFDSYGGNRLEYNSGYVDLDQPCYDDGKRRKWRTVLGDKAPPAVLARSPAGGIHELVAEADIAKVKGLGRVGAGARAKQRSGRGSGKAGSHAAAQREKEKIEARAFEQVLEQLVELATAAKVDTELWRLLARGVVSLTWHESLSAVTRRRGLLEKGQRPAEAIAPELERLSAKGLRGLIIELLASRITAGTLWYTVERDAKRKADDDPVDASYEDRFAQRAAKHFGIDLLTVLREVRKEFRDAAKAKQKAAAEKAKKRAAAKKAAKAKRNTNGQAAAAAKTNRKPAGRRRRTRATKPPAAVPGTSS